MEVGRLLCFATALVLSCGGRSEELPSGAPAGGSGGMQAGSAGSAGAGAGTGGGATTAGSAGSAAMCTPYPRSSCVRNCLGSEGTMAECIGGEWLCPPDRFFRADCPADSCGLSQGSCCHPTTGDRTGSTCGPDEKWLPCEGGSERIADRAACIPESLNVDDCLDLDGTVCEGPALQCHNAGGCRSSCRCIGGEGGLVWFCVIPAC